MRVVIDIDDNIYTRLFDNGVPIDLTTTINDAKDIATAIRKGTPLPKGHGRLIDADEAIKILKSLGNRDYRRKNGTIQEAEKMLRFDEYIPTIIEADKEGDK